MFDDMCSMFGCPEGFFTRDDCIDYIEEPLRELIEQNFPGDVSIRCYIEDGNLLDVDIEVDGYFTNIKLDRPIDMRRIRRPSDLQKYVPELFNKFSAEYDAFSASDIINAATEPNPADWQFNPVPLRSLKKGEWFTVKPIAYPTDKQVYIKDDYDREEKKFMCGRCDDISYSTYFKGDKLVYTDFIY